MAASEQDRYLALTEHAPVGLFEMDAELQCVLVNQRFCAMTGLTPEAAMGDGWGAALHPDDVEAIAVEFSRAMQAGDDYRIEHRWVRPDGTVTWCLAVGKARRDAAGQVTGFLAVVTDVTAEHHTEARLAALLEASSDAIFIIDTDTTIRYVSPEMTRRYGWVADELIGTPGIDLLHPDDLGAAAEAMERLLAGGPGAQLRVEYRSRHRDGHFVPVEAVVTNCLDNEAIGGLVLNARDVTDRLRSEQLLTEAQEHYRRSVETADKGIWTIDPDNRTTFVNRRTAEMLGYSVDEMLGASLFAFMDDEGRTIWCENLERRRTGISEHHDFKFRHRDGHAIWTRLSTSPILGDDGSYEGATALVTDVTAQREIEEQLRYNEARLTALFEASSDIMAVLEPSGEWHASPAGTRILGYPMGFDPPGGILSLVHPDDLELAATAIQEMFEDCRSGHEPLRVRIRHLDGHYRWFDCTAKNQLDDPNVKGIVIIARDVTLQKEAQDAQRTAESRFRSAFERGPLGIALIGLDGRFMDVNPAFCKTVGRSRDELIGTESVLLVQDEDRERIVGEGRDRVLGDVAEVRPVWMRRPDGTIVWILADVALVPGATGEPDCIIALMADVTERKRLEERLEFQAFHDPLTKLPNRALLQDLMEQAWERRTSTGTLALLFVDLDRFKLVNDTLGHDAGDEVLLLAARRLAGSMRTGDTVARLGGDEFVVICEAICGRDEAVTIANRIRESLARTYRLSAGTAQVAASVGVAIDTDHVTVDDLLRDADVAAYRAKELGRDRVEVFNRVVGL
ncbi:MAG: PAS domain S-box protein [Actinobacteria bacterium]|nr:PAS domain S-box protein [Actinomycetota bacterium]